MMPRKPCCAAVIASFLLILSSPLYVVAADDPQKDAMAIAEAALTEISDTFRYSEVELRELAFRIDNGVESGPYWYEYKLTQRFPHFKYERTDKAFSEATWYDGKVFRIFTTIPERAPQPPTLTITDRRVGFWCIARGLSFYGVPVRGMEGDGPTRDWQRWFADTKGFENTTLTAQLVHENDRRQVIVRVVHGGSTLEQLVIDITDKPYVHSYELGDTRREDRTVSMVASETRLIENVRVPVEMSIRIGNMEEGNRFACELVSFKRIDPATTTPAEACAIELPQVYRYVDYVERVAYDLLPDGTKKSLPMYDPATGKSTE